MPISLPYRFDTSPVVQLILRGVLGLVVLVIAPGILYSVFVSHNQGAAVLLLVIGVLTIYFGRLFLRNLMTSRGTITAEAVEVEPGVLFGASLQGPRGRFPIQQFRAVLVQRISPWGQIQERQHERVILAGQASAPDILVARTGNDAGRALGRDLAAALGLPYTEETAPY